MEKIDKIAELIKYNKTNLNEADTRFRIIDTLLIDIFDWPKDKAFLEVILEEGIKADYILKGKNSRPVLVIEAKKNKIPFTLPNTKNSDQKLRKIKVKELITDSYIKDATFQCKEYCEDIGCDFGCITNGNVWIFFNFKPPSLPWKSLSAYVISDLSYFLTSFTEAYNFLSYNSVTSDGSIKNTLGVIRNKNEELFYAKNSIFSYNMQVTKNVFASTFNSISKIYFDDIEVTNSDFMDSCYVTDRKSYTQLNAGIVQFVEDAITPFFKNYGFREISDETHASDFGKKIRKFATNSKKSALMILFGGRGAGKSTFIKKFLYHDPPTSIKDNSVIAIIDLLKCTQDASELSNEIWETLCKQIDFNNLLSKKREDLIILFNKEYRIYHKQYLSGLGTDSVEYHRLTSDFLKECTHNKKLVAESLSQYWKKHSKGLIIVLDNLDQLRPDMQDICFLTSVEISSKLDCLVITSMREERFFNVKNRGVLDAYHNNGFHLPSPLISHVIRKRIIYLIKKIESSSDPLDEFSADSVEKLEEIKIVLRVFLKNLSSSSSEFRNFLENVTHGDVRMALNYFKEFISSGYTNVDEISKNPAWTFSHHQVLKPMMIPERFFYDERLSNIPNLFQIRDPSNGSHFTSIRLLRIINSYSGDDKNSGFIDVKVVLDEMENKFNTGFESQKVLDIFLRKSLVESSNRLESYSSDVDQIRLTSFGRHMLTDLIKRFVYLELISIDTGVKDSKLAEIIKNKASSEVKFFQNGDFISRLECRIERVNHFLDYLLNQEQLEYAELMVDKNEVQIIPEFITYFNEEKLVIQKSAQRKFKNLGSYD